MDVEWKPGAASSEYKLALRQVKFNIAFGAYENVAVGLGVAYDDVYTMVKLHQVTAVVDQVS